MKEFALHKMRTIKELEEQDNMLMIETLKERTRSFNKPVFKTDGVNIISEVKQASPSRGEIKSVDVLEQAEIYSGNGAAAISVLTDKIFFNGSYDYLKKIGVKIEKPLLCKEFVFFKHQVELAYLCGADMVLMINRILNENELHFVYDYIVNKGMTPIVEIHASDEIERVLELKPEYVMVNMRNLETLEMDFDAGIKTLKELPETVKKISASGIQSAGKIKSLKEQTGVNIFLVGTSIMESDNPGNYLRELANVY
ncbi:MAG: indole-3-glycerol-phosphate synthase [Spirochaetes bacterium]|nr:indole-3-glycerol-phosphate synthase [Spirochaetota bacterium]